MKAGFWVGLFLIVAGSSKAATFTVCTPCEVQTIKKAIEVATRYDTIVISYGIYREGNIRITKPLYLIGIDYPIIDGENQSEIFTIISDSVTLEGLQIQNVGISYTKDRAGINVISSNAVTVKNNKLIYTFFVVYFRKSAHCLIEGNEITGNAVEEMSSGNAIHLWDCKSMFIKNNKVIRHRDGIYLEFVDDSMIRDNLSEDNIRYGLHFMFSNDDQYIDNIFKDNGAGVAVMFSRNILMKSNHFDHNWGMTSYGLLLKEIYDSEINNNLFTTNTTAIYGESATRIKISKNTFDQNGWALKLLGSCMDNVINNNNFLNNTFDVATNSIRNYNDYTGNYWSDYTGYDLDKNGIGDVPHRPIKLFSYIVTRNETSLILLRSLFIDLLNFAENITPVFTPETLIDDQPLMKPAL